MDPQGEAPRGFPLKEHMDPMGSTEPLVVYVSNIGYVGKNRPDFEKEPRRACRRDRGHVGKMGAWCLRAEARGPSAIEGCWALRKPCKAAGWHHHAPTLHPMK